MLDQNKKYRPTGCATTLVSVSKGLFRPGAPMSCPTHEHRPYVYTCINKVTSSTVVVTLQLGTDNSFLIKPTIS